MSLNVKTSHDYQQPLKISDNHHSDETIGVNDFSIESSLTTVRFSFETLIEETKPLIKAKHELIEINQS